MSNNIQYKATYTENIDASRVVSTFLTKVFTWMFMALGISAATAYYFASSPALMAYLINENGLSIGGWIVMLSPLLIVLAFGTMVQKMSARAAGLLFAFYAIIMGVSLSFIFLSYTSGSIFKSFFSAAIMFGLMAFAGYTTRKDLSKFGSLLFMALIGIIIASLVNVFMNSAGLDYIISIAGILIFTGLTAYDVQKLKRIALLHSEESETKTKWIIIGALTLYLDFINLFLFLLRFFGNRN